MVLAPVTRLQGNCAGLAISRADWQFGARSALVYKARGKRCWNEKPTKALCDLARECLNQAAASTGPFRRGIMHVLDAGAMLGGNLVDFPMFFTP